MRLFAGIVSPERGGEGVECGVRRAKKRSGLASGGHRTGWPSQVPWETRTRGEKSKVGVEARGDGGSEAWRRIWPSLRDHVYRRTKLRRVLPRAPASMARSRPTRSRHALPVHHLMSSDN